MRWFARCGSAVSKPAAVRSAFLRSPRHHRQKKACKRQSESGQPSWCDPAGEHVTRSRIRSPDGERVLRGLENGISILGVLLDDKFFARSEQCTQLIRWEART